MRELIEQSWGMLKWSVKTVAMVAVLLALVVTHEHSTRFTDSESAAAPLSVNSPYYQAGRDARVATFRVIESLPAQAPGTTFLSGMIDATTWMADLADQRERNAKSVGLVRISDRYGMRYHPILKRRKMHNGVDFAAPRGTPIVAVADGVVTYKNWRGGAGRFVKISHEGYSSAYAHMSRFAKGMRPGTEVEAGQVIGYVGASGLATGNHLHFSILVNRRFVNPLSDGFDRLQPLREAQLLVDFEQGVLNTLTSIHTKAFDWVDVEELEEDDDIVFEDSFL